MEREPLLAVALSSVRFSSSVTRDHLLRPPKRARLPRTRRPPTELPRARLPPTRVHPPSLGRQPRPTPSRSRPPSRPRPRRSSTPIPSPQAATGRRRSQAPERRRRGFPTDRGGTTRRPARAADGPGLSNRSQRPQMSPRSPHRRPRAKSRRSAVGHGAKRSAGRRESVRLKPVAERLRCRRRSLCRRRRHAAIRTTRPHHIAFKHIATIVDVMENRGNSNDTYAQVVTLLTGLAKQ